MTPRRRHGTQASSDGAINSCSSGRDEAKRRDRTGDRGLRIRPILSANRTHLTRGSIGPVHPTASGLLNFDGRIRFFRRERRLLPELPSAGPTAPMTRASGTFREGRCSTFSGQLNISSGEVANGRLDCHRHAKPPANRRFQNGHPTARSFLVGLRVDSRDDVADRGLPHHEGQEDDGPGLGDAVRAGLMAVPLKSGSRQVPARPPVPVQGSSSVKTFRSTRS